MSSQDTLNYALAAGFLVGVGFFSYVMYEVTQTLKTANMVLADVKDTTRDITDLKDNVKLGAFGFLSSVFHLTRRALS
jgi:hypothetical protein